MADLHERRVITISEAQLNEALGSVFRRVYLWMFIGLMVTAGSAS